MKLMICGHGRHGKDTVALFFKENLGMTFESSSMFCCKLFIFDRIHKTFGYENLIDCFNDRSNHRALWYELICEYNEDDKARLSKKIFAEYDMYVGIRNAEELAEARKQKVFDLSIWVDADRRKPVEPTSSNTVTEDMCDITINNNGTEEELQLKVAFLTDLLVF
jgi:hypothetical protein